MGAADGLHPRFRESEVFYLALLNQVLHRARRIFNRYVGIHPVLIKQIDNVSLQAREGGLGDFLDVLRTAVEPRLFSRARIDLEPEFRGDLDLSTKWGECFPDKFFVGEWTVDFGGIEECDAPLHRRANQRSALLLVDGWAEAEAQSHAAETE